MKEKYAIDFVITWVDGSDTEWQKEKDKYQGTANGDMRAKRYRDWDCLKYWFRSVEKYAPWVNKIYFVTYGHLPKWLDVNNRKLVIVNHKDFIPAKYLPTFSSRAIDMNFDKIESLSEHFVYFNDDMYIMSPVKKTDFFINGYPCDTAVLNAPVILANVSNNANNAYTAAIFGTLPINRSFKKAECIKKNFFKWFSPKYRFSWIRTLLLLPWSEFTGFMPYHIPYSYLKSTYAQLWEKEPEILDQACMHKFRTTTDVNHWVFSYWQMASGNFAPRDPNIGKQFRITGDRDKNREIFSFLRKNNIKFACLNDEIDDESFDIVKEDMRRFMEKRFPEKSKFEK